METKENFFTESRQNIETLIQDNILLLKLQAVEKTSKLIALIASGLLIIVLGFFITLFLSMLATYYFIDLTGNVYIGIGIIGGFYLLVLILIILFRKQIVGRFITNMVINIFFETNKENLNNES